MRGPGRIRLQGCIALSLLYICDASNSMMPNGFQPLKNSKSMDALAISTGAVVGALARHNLCEVAARMQMKPWGVAAINVAGSFVLGAVAASAPVPPRMKLLIGTGFCGSFTTFSTFSVDTVQMMQAGQARKAIAYVMVNNVMGIGAAGAGMMLFAGKLKP